MIEASRVVQSRQQLFDELVTVAIDTDEIAHSLRQAQGIDKHYLHERCTAERTRHWAGVVDASSVYDEAADRHRRVIDLNPVTAVVRDVLTSTPLQYSGALVGLLLVMFSWVLYSPGPMAVFPNHLLLTVAMVLVGIALVTQLTPFDSLVLRSDRPRRVVNTIVVPAMTTVAIVLFELAVAHLVPLVDMERMGASGQGEDALKIAVAVCLVAVPFVRARKESRVAHPDLSLRYSVFLEGKHRPSFVVPLLILGASPLLVEYNTGPSAWSGREGAVIVFGAPNPILLFAGLGLIALSALVALLGFRLRAARFIREDFLSARESVAKLLTETVILPFLRAEINKHTQVRAVEIDVREAPGLGQLSDPAYLVSTAAAAKVGKLLESMPGGSIGLAGARGAGKTTLIESYCAGPRRRANSLAVMVSAPVEYSAREFILHLYAKICQEVIGSRSAADGLDAAAAVRRRRGRLKLGVSGLVSGMVGVALIVLYNTDVRIAPQIAWALAFVALGVVLIGGAAGARDRRARVSGQGLRDHAAARLEEIRFQQSFSSSWSGAVKVPIGVEATIGGGRGLIRQALHLPEIVDSLRDFLEAAARERPVVIGIDELDKMESETAAEQFLNEVKSIFGLRGCYFLVSVSEEAMSSFERRGLPFRDVFDSTFDEIVWFDHLTAAEAIASIDRRVLLMPVPFKQLCFALSGGLPRDLIRVARLVLDAQSPTGPTGLTRLAMDLVAQDVTRKARGIGVAARRIGLEPDVGRFLLVCAQIRKTSVDPRSLMRLIDELSLTPESRARAESTTAAAGTFLKLVGELACFLYYAATVLDYFDESAADARWHDASALHLLAEARQAFSTSTRVAWEGISSFRSSWGMTAVAFPSALQPATTAPAVRQ